jgi:hypothetical protein
MQTRAITKNFKRFSSYQNGTVSLLEEYDDTIYHISGKTVERAYYVDFGDMKKDKRFYSSMRDPTAELGKMEEYCKEHDICNIISLEETKTHIYFVYFHKNTVNYVFYNKKTKKFIDVYKDYGDKENKVFPINNDIDGCPFAWILSTDGESLYGIIEAHEILELKESIQNSNAANKDKLLKMIDGINEDDNPVIVKTKMKKLIKL